VVAQPGAVAVDSFFHRYRQTISFEETGDLAHDLTVQILAVINDFRGGPARSWRS